MSEYRSDESGAVAARLDEIRLTLDRFGPFVIFAPQFGIEAAGSGWDGNRKPTQMDTRFSVSTGVQAGRSLEGAIRTRIAGRDPDRSTLQGLSEEHLEEMRAEDPDKLPADMADIEWASIRVEVDGVPADDRHAVFRGYECVAFAIDGRMVSSIFSVFDASRLAAGFVSVARIPH